MAAVAFLLHEEEQGGGGPERIVRDYSNPLDGMADKEVVDEYRMPPHLIRELCNLVENDVKGITRRSVPVYLKVLATLDYFAHGKIIRKAGKNHSMGKTTCWRAIHDVTEAICTFAPQFIKFPKDVGSKQRVKEGFYELACIPSVLGAIDGILIQIQAPSEHEDQYVCRKQFHAINVQVVGDANLMLLDLVARWPGSTHDAFIWANSELCRMFEEGEIDDGWLIGDSAYPLRPWLLTPFQNPSTAAEGRYNRSLKHARNVIERLIGVMKMRWKCIHKTGGCITYKPVMTCKIITAVGVLHNMCIANRVPLPDGEEENNPEADVDVFPPPGMGDRADGVRARQQLVASRFTH